MRTRLLQRLESYIFQPKSADVETVLIVSVPVGGFMGVMTGLREAETKQDGYIWRTVVYGSLGLGAGFLSGMHYRKVIFLTIAGDVLNSLVKKLKY